MKKIIVLGLLFGLLFSSCTKEPITPDPTFSDISWYSSEAEFNKFGTLTFTAGRALAIFDLSQGTVSHEWKIEEGTTFLKEGFKNVRTAPFPDLTPFIDADKGLVTSNKTVFIFFPKAGVYKVTLKNTFKDKVTYKGATPIDPVKVGVVWFF